MYTYICTVHIYIYIHIYELYLFLFLILGFLAFVAAKVSVLGFSVAVPVLLPLLRVLFPKCWIVFLKDFLTDHLYQNYPGCL
jgi:hypothetical protein